MCIKFSHSHGNITFPPFPRKNRNVGKHNNNKKLLHSKESIVPKNTYEESMNILHFHVYILRRLHL